MKVKSIRDLFQASLNYKITILIGLLNIAVFLTYGLGEITTLSLLKLGANFAPFTLGNEPFRLISSLFLHGNILHLIVNMYSLFFLGSQLESTFGSKVLIKVYLLTGLLAGLSSVVFNLFTVSVGASGAIFGLYGYYLIYALRKSQSSQRQSIILNFVIYLVIMVLLGNRFRFDNAAHFGGLFMGVILGLIDQYSRVAKLASISLGILLLPVYLLIPKWQVDYYNAFQYMSTTDKKIEAVFGLNLDNSSLEDEINKVILLPDSILRNFNAINDIPQVLQRDTTSIKHVFSLRKKQLNYFKKGVSQESYIFIDSIQYINFLLSKVPPLEYPLDFSPPSIKDQLTVAPNENLVFDRQFYDKNWLEVKELNGSYYRVGYRDSLMDWHSTIQDYYMSGAIQMKGNYSRGLRNGIFIYYNEDSTYSSAGRYYQDNPVGKWETYYHNGRLASEIKYIDGNSLVVNTWDSLGNQLVISGQGVEKYSYSDGTLRYKREITNGLNDGFIEGYNADGSLRFKEYTENGNLLKGIAHSPDGATHTYDRSAHYPRPDGGLDKFYEYINLNNTYKSDSIDLTVHIRFDVTSTGIISNIRYLERAGIPYDDYAKKLLLNGPEWGPAMAEGYIPRTAQAEVFIRY